MKLGNFSGRIGAAALGFAVFALPALCGLARADGQAQPAAQSNATAQAAAQNSATAQNNATQDKIGEKEVSLTMRLYDGVFSGPMPYWVRKARQLNDLKGYRNQKGNSFVVEFIPKAQNFEHWTRLYGVYAFHVPGLGMDKFTEIAKQTFREGCRQGAEIKALGSANDAAVLEFSCPELNPDASLNKGLSVEHGYMYIAHTGDSFVKVYQSWRGASSADAESPDWATNPEISRQVIDGIRKMRFTPAK